MYGPVFLYLQKQKRQIYSGIFGPKDGAKDLCQNDKGEIIR
jgi:hypothetical protein